MTRALHAARLALTGTLLLWASLFAHVVWVFGIEAGYLNGGVFPLTPSVPVTALGLGLHCALAAALFGPPALLIGLLAGTRPWGTALLALAYALLWFGAASDIAGLFAADFGTTWSAREAFSELFFRPALTPAAFAAGFLPFVWLSFRRRAAGA